MHRFSYHPFSLSILKTDKIKNAMETFNKTTIHFLKWFVLKPQRVVSVK